MVRTSVSKSGDGIDAVRFSGRVLFLISKFEVLIGLCTVSSCNSGSNILEHAACRLRRPMVATWARLLPSCKWIL